MAGAPWGRRSVGKMIRDGLVILVILAMALPFIVAAIGGPSLTTAQRGQADRARRAAYVQQDWLSNSMAHKVVAVKEVSGGGLVVRERYYTFFGIPWGWSEATVASDGTISGLSTHLTLGGS